MTPSSSRRAFISVSGRVAFGLPLLSLAACGRRNEAAAPDGYGRWQSLIAFVEEEIPALLETGVSTPGVAMAIVADAKLLWSRGFGVKDRTTSGPVDDDTVFEFGSVSKTVFAYVVMKACETGILQLDTPLTKYGAAQFVQGEPRLHLITPRHILSHTSGLPNWRSKGDPLAIQFTPGARWQYSGEGYNYLQSLLTHLTGRVDPNHCRTFEDDLRVCATDFDAYMKANLFAPFGMTSSGYMHRDGMAQPHDDKGRFIPGRMTTAIEAARYGAAGALHSTVKDYARFLIETIDPRPADAYRLSAASLQEMLRPQVSVTDTLSWGLGWVIEQHPGMGDIISHSGDNPGFKAMTAASARRGSAVVIVTNGDRGFEDVIRPLLRSAPMRELLPISI